MKSSHSAPHWLPAALALLTVAALGVEFVAQVAPDNLLRIPAVVFGVLTVLACLHRRRPDALAPDGLGHDVSAAAAPHEWRGCIRGQPGPLHGRQPGNGAMAVPQSG